MQDEILELVREWLRYAANDLFTARYMFENAHPKQTEISAFHCQQTAEKAIKAYLISRNIDPPKTHDLDFLCQLCVQQDTLFQTLSAAAANLTPFAVAARYPKQLVSDEAEVKRAIDDAQQIYDFCVKQIDR
jgi:HEPN domain-containing protein